MTVTPLDLFHALEHLKSASAIPKEYMGLSTQRYLPVGSKREFDKDEQATVDKNLNENWFGRVFESYGTPAAENLASTTKAAIMGALLGAVPGGAFGAAATSGPGDNAQTALGGLAGAGVGGTIGGLLGYYLRNQGNEGLLEMMRRAPDKNPTMRDIMSDPVFQHDKDRELARQLNVPETGLAAARMMAARGGFGGIFLNRE